MMPAALTLTVGGVSQERSTDMAKKGKPMKPKGGKGKGC